MTTALLDRPALAHADPGTPVFLDPSGRRQRLLERALVVVLVAALLVLGLVCRAFA